MGGIQTRPFLDYDAYQDRFRQTSQNIQRSPKQQRKCNDVCCLVMFLLITLTFMIIGIVYLAKFGSQDISRFTHNFQFKKTSLGHEKSHEMLLRGLKDTSRHLIVAQSKQGDDSNSLRRNRQWHKYQHQRQQYHKQMHDHDVQSSMSSQSSSGLTPFFTFSSENEKAKEQAEEFKIPKLKPTGPYIGMMAGLSLVLSFLIVILVSKIPKVMVYGMMIVASIIVVGGLIFGIIKNKMEVVLVAGLFGALWVIVLLVILCCFRQQFNAALVLLKITGRFLKRRPGVFLAPLAVLFSSLLYFLFWMATFVAIQLDRPFQEYAQHYEKYGDNQLSSSVHDALTVLWLLINLFYCYILYYVMVFLIATSTALWYYSLPGFYLFKGLKYIVRSHIGSFSFASLTVALMSFLRSMAESNNDNTNVCSMLCLAMTRCCISFLDEVLKVLNHNTIIVMAVTGESYLQCAKSTIFIIYQNFGLFLAIDLVLFLVDLCVIFFVLLLPTSIGLALLQDTYDQKPQNKIPYLLFGTLLIFFICAFISMLVITILTQVLACVFIFFCLDQRFQNFNYAIVNEVPQEMRTLFEQIDRDQRGLDFNRFYRQRNQPVRRDRGNANNQRNQNNANVNYNDYIQPPENAERGYN